MNPAIIELARSITGKNSLQECSTEELQQLTEQYPFFGPAQFLLARKLKDEDSSLYPQQAQKALLYFRDDLWFEYLLGEGDETGQVIPPPVEIPAEEAVVTDSQRIAGPETPGTADETGPGKVSIPEKEAEPAADAEPIASIMVMAGDSAPAEELPPEHPDEISLPELPKFKFEPVDASATALTFEPYHTIDYFASQGIRASAEDKSKDRFSQQLKSFTEWLKAMKRLPDAEVVSNAASEQKVEQMAEHSITDREIVTEAMADVWEKQGNALKAIAIYQKLSLLNPAKSSYFAAKIEHLKHP